MAHFLLGTSGWNYPEWQGKFFPQDLSSRKWLSFYAERFATVEVNYSFYHLPTEKTYANWYAQTPADFVFALKASRIITHYKRFKNVRQEWKEFVTRAIGLKEKLGPILLQCPPNFHATRENLSALEEFLHDAMNQRSQRIAMEFRHESCFGEESLELLRRHHTALVLSHSKRYPIPPIIATGDFVYFRFHGPRELFSSSYSEVELRTWGTYIKRLLKQGRDVYAYFNNDVRGYAISNAETLRAVVR